VRPFPIVADADELIREAAYRARRAKEPLLFSLVKLGIGRVYASERVREEVERNLPRLAGKHTRAARDVWENDYLPDIRWVAMPDRTQTGFADGEEILAEHMKAIMSLHAADAPTAELALHCAPCFVLTGNEKHLHAAGFGDDRTRDALAAAADKAMLEFAAIFAEACGEAIGHGLWVAGSKAFGQFRRSPILILLALGAILGLGRIHHHRVEWCRDAGSRILLRGGLLLQEALARHEALMAELTPSLFHPSGELSASVDLARALVRHPTPLPARTIAADIGSELGSVLPPLRTHPAFNFWPGRGWTLGYHLEIPKPPVLVSRH